MQSKVVALILMASVALALFASVQAEEDKVHYWGVNKKVCHGKLNVECEACCQEHDYKNGDYDQEGTHCTCWLSTDKKLRNSDQIRAWPERATSYTVIQEAEE